MGFRLVKKASAAFLYVYEVYIVNAAQQRPYRTRAFNLNVFLWVLFGVHGVWSTVEFNESYQNLNDLVYAKGVLEEYSTGGSGTGRSFGVIRVDGQRVKVRLPQGKFNRYVGHVVEVWYGKKRRYAFFWEYRAIQFAIDGSYIQKFSTYQRRSSSTSRIILSSYAIWTALVVIVLVNTWRRRTNCQVPDGSQA